MTKIIQFYNFSSFLHPTHSFITSQNVGCSSALGAGKLKIYYFTNPLLCQPNSQKKKRMP